MHRCLRSIIYEHILICHIVSSSLLDLQTVENTTLRKVLGEFSTYL